jgi:serine protease Do
MFKTLISLFIIGLIPISLSAQEFDYEKLYKKASSYTVSITLMIEVSFGTQTTEAKSRAVGTIVSPEGLVLFDGTPIDSDDPFSLMSGMQVNAEPKSIEIKMLDGTTYPAEFIGIDRYTKIGFCRIQTEGEAKFDYVKFKKRKGFKTGDWLALYMLLPEYMTPSLAADVGMVSAIIEEPENFVLTVGFNELELTSVLYDTTGTPVGILGNLNNPALTGFDPSRMMESFSQVEDFLPMLGLLDADRLNKLIAEPPQKGKADRGWMGIYLQALTDDIAKFWGLGISGGIIVNEVVKESPAFIAGIQTGDIVTHVSGVPIEVDKEENLPVFQKKISEMGAGVGVDFTILRRNQGTVDTLDINLILAAAPLSPAEASEYENKHFEMKLRNMVFADYNINNLDRSTFKGVVVKEIERGGWFEVGGIMPGDIVQSIDGEKVESIEDAEKVLEQIAQKEPEDVVFFIWRDNKTLFINIKTNW